MSNVTISESIKYIGADDTTLDLFEANISFLTEFPIIHM